jgi:hypothetical protein
MAKRVSSGGDKPGPNGESIPPHIKAYLDDQIQQLYKAQDYPVPYKKSWRYSWRSTSPITKGTFMMTAGVCFATIAYSIIN